MRKRLCADVPLGAFLSGGLDSSAVVAFMTRHARGRVRTFSIGFAGHPAYDETAWARQVADHLGTDHTSFVVEPRALDLVDRLVFHHDGPCGDSSAVPTYRLAELTRKEVTVALSGDGGDEVFAGYLRLYGGALSERMPAALRRGLSRTAGPPPQPSDRQACCATPAVRRGGPTAAGGTATCDGTRISPPSCPPSCARTAPAASAERLRASFHVRAVRGHQHPGRPAAAQLQDLPAGRPAVKTDRMSMAHGLEARSPFLDTAVVEFGAALPHRLRMRSGRARSCCAARAAGSSEAILARRRWASAPPWGRWFRTALAASCRSGCAGDGAAYQYLRPQPVAELVRRHLAGEADLSPQIWSSDPGRLAAGRGRAPVARP